MKIHSKSIFPVVLLSPSTSKTIEIDYEEINAVYFYGDTVDQYKTYSLFYLDEIASHPKFQKNKTTVLYIHGFRDNFKSEGVKTVIRAFLYRKEFNVLALNWAFYAKGNYITNAVPNLIRIAQVMGYGVYTLFKYQVIESNKLHGVYKNTKFPLIFLPV